MNKSADRLGRELEAGINASPSEGGHIQKASYCAHEGRLYVDTNHVQRMAVLQRNHEMRKALDGVSRNRENLAGDMMFSIPHDDWELLMKNTPHYYQMDQRQKRRFWDKQRQLHPEWFIA